MQRASKVLILYHIAFIHQTVNDRRIRDQYCIYFNDGGRNNIYDIKSSVRLFFAGDDEI